MSARSHLSSARHAAFTLVELVLAVGLFSILILALLRLVDTSVQIWGRTDENRELLETGGALMDLLAEDVHALEGGARGDLVSDWANFDLDRDGISGAPRQRLRLVRHVGAAELQRLAGGAAGGTLETFDRALVEVGWAWLPLGGEGPDEKPIGTLVRGMRLVGDRETLSFFDPGFFNASGKPVPGSLHEASGGILWFDLWFASQTSLLHDGWTLGEELAHCSASWDAWNKGRPDTSTTVFNKTPPGMPQAKDVPILPRRVRIELELERPVDLKQRTRLVGAVTEQATTLDVRDGRKLPPAGEMILIGEEWMKVLSVIENRVSVERGRRATRASSHAADALVHYGWRSVREISVDMTREDWDL